MRCDCCNVQLNDWEATAKDVGGRYLDTCKKCLQGLGIAQLGRPDLNPEEEVEDDEFVEYVDDEFEDELWDED